VKVVVGRRARKKRYQAKKQQLKQHMVHYEPPPPGLADLIAVLLGKPSESKEKEA
jgi:hypothetical protein